MSHHILTLKPSDVLFFRDGRPMEGASSGHGAAWPLPNVLDAALHHALRRAEFSDIMPHSHTLKRSGKELSPDREAHGRQFGSLKTAGPFPVRNAPDGSPEWFFPRPADAQRSKLSTVTHRPLHTVSSSYPSSLPSKLSPAVNTLPPDKGKPEKWMSSTAWRAYLEGKDSAVKGYNLNKGHYLDDEAIFSAEHNIGIGISPETGTQNGEQLYSASYLRLKESFSIGLIASCMDKGSGSTADYDLLERTFLNSGYANHILVGGQQRTCTVQRTTARPIPLPIGKIKGFNEHDGKFLIKWVLLTPAIFPRIEAQEGVTQHDGGWLPTWVHSELLSVQLKDPTSPKPSRIKGETRAEYRQRLHKELENNIAATLVAAIVGKPIPVTGWALTRVDSDDQSLKAIGGAKPTHLAVPAGSVYYFACDSAEAAEQLAAALNWHGSNLQPDTIVNRRSSLLGEKGFGIGVCGTWSYLEPQATTQPKS